MSLRYVASLVSPKRATDFKDFLSSIPLAAAPGLDSPHFSWKACRKVNKILIADATATT